MEGFPFEGFASLCEEGARSPAAIQPSMALWVMMLLEQLVPGGQSWGDPDILFPRRYYMLWRTIDYIGKNAI
jgi:hypothetical protein